MSNQPLLIYQGLASPHKKGDHLLIFMVKGGCAPMKDVAPHSTSSKKGVAKYPLLSSSEGRPPLTI